ncbi:hypothetical protein DE146DRAFT_740540 [Phaeosphaeria sp. MPI-PUGE-AT-0046c]|nr:hypothetical protein DE146DRAFT_740540 [Phaeosphaeria sp. MPI-PUGE-AT-0046c]
MSLISALISYLSPVFALSYSITENCKCTPSTNCWPAAEEWSLFNGSINGALIQGVPPASVCYSDQANYDAEACTFIVSQWFNSTWHATDPVSIDYPIWANNSCNPIYPNGTSVTGDASAGTKGCSMGAYPAYVVNATTSEQVSTALKWASAKDIRVVVKSTGHSITGRSVGYGSLSIWTHHLRGIEYIEDFQPTSCQVETSGLRAARVAAGHTGIEVLLEIAKYDAVAITGANPDVGLVGWLTGGGHGRLTQTYGMGVDHLLEATIITPDGESRLTNPCENPDLFFAVRGGGGGTFGVVTEMVIQVLPSPKTTFHTFRVMSLSTTMAPEFYDFIGFLHTEMPRLKDGGLSGYYYIVGPPTVPTLSFAWTFMAFDAPNGTVERLMMPIEGYLKQRNHLFASSQSIEYADTYLDIFNGTYTNEAVATGGPAIGSRLMSSESLADANLTAKVLAKIGPSPDIFKPNLIFQSQSPTSNPLIIGHMIASPDTPSYSPSTVSLNPSWRNTLVHLVVAGSIPDGSSPSLAHAVYADITNKTSVLQSLAPETGAYFNEANPYEVEWQKSFWGVNYERLREVKNKYDPNKVLWCLRCVGSEDLVEREGKGLCRSGTQKEEL